MEKCIILSVKEFEEKLAKVTNGGVILIFDRDGWTYGSTEEYGDVNDEELYELLSNEVEAAVKKIYIDDGDAIIVVQ